MFRAIANVFRVAELRTRLAYTLALLAVYRLGVFINTPGVDRVAMSLALHPVLARRKAAGAGERELRNVVAASAEGYAFPTNLDRDQPVGGLAPQTQAELLWRALRDGWEPDAFAGALRAHTERRAT